MTGKDLPMEVERSGTKLEIGSIGYEKALRI